MQNTNGAPPNPVDQGGYSKYIAPLMLLYILKMFIVGVLIILGSLKSIPFKIFIVLTFISMIGEVFMYTQSYWVKLYLIVMTAIHLLTLILLIWRNKNQLKLLWRIRYSNKDKVDNTQSVFMEEIPPLSDTASTGLTSRISQAPDMLSNVGMHTSLHEIFVDVSSQNEFSDFTTKSKSKLTINEKIRRRLFSTNVMTKDSKYTNNSSDLARTSGDNLIINKYMSPISPNNEDDEAAVLNLSTETIFEDFNEEIQIDNFNHLVNEIQEDLLKNNSVPKQSQVYAVNVNTSMERKIMKSSIISEDDLVEIPLDDPEEDDNELDIADVATSSDLFDIPKEWEEWEESKKRESSCSANKHE